jgi:hypothetical protein
MRALQSAMGLVTLQVQHCALRTVCVSVTLHCTLQQTKNGQKSTKKVPKVAQKWPEITNLPAISTASAVEIVLPQCAAAQVEFAAAASHI